MSTDKKTHFLARAASVGFRRVRLQVAASVAMACSLLPASESDPGKSDATQDATHLRTASTHPMKFWVSLPKNWSPDRKWPVLVAPNAHYSAKAKTIELFAPIRDARKLDFIIVAPLAINADPVAGMKECQGPIVESIKAADAADGFRDEAARAKFDSEGILAVLKDVRALYHGEDRVYITGFSSSTHIAYMFLFSHPEILKGCLINSGGYAGRGVDEDHISLMNSPERARVEIKIMVGESDPGYEFCMANWKETKAKLLSYGHPEARMQVEVIRKGNPEHLGTGHGWYATKILDFFAGIEKGDRGGQ